MSLRKSFVAVLSLISAVALSWSALAAPTSAAPALKKNYTSGISPTSATANTSTSFTFQITNAANSQQTLGSANVFVPTNYSSVSAGTVTTSNGESWFVPSGGVFAVTTPYPGTLVQLRSNNQGGLAASHWVRVQITATAGCPNATDPLWHTQVKQSNDFSGTGNDFKNSGSDPSVTLTGCPDHLRFGVQPSNTSAGQPISPAVTVRVEDSSNNLITASTASITMAITSGTPTAGGPGTLLGTKTVSAGNVTAGIATFSNLVIDTAGTGYTLTASSSGFTSINSNAFDITGVAVPCGDQSPCQTTPADNPTHGHPTTGSLVVPTDLSKVCPDASCFLSLDPDSILGSTVTFCGGSSCIGNVIFFNTPANATTGRITAVGEWDKSVSGMKGASQFNVYLDGSTDPLPACTNPSPAPSDPACVVSKFRTGVGDLVITVSFPLIGDPRWGTN